MAFEEEKEKALLMLTGIEKGLMTPDEVRPLLEEADPTLVYFIFKWLKKYYNREHDDFELVRGRLNDVRNSHRSLTRKAKAGEEDAVVEWFEGNHHYGELEAEEFIDLIVEKLEG